MWNVDNVCLLMSKKNNKSNKINNHFWSLLPCCFTHVMYIARLLRSQSFRHLQSRAPTALAGKVLSSRWRRHGSGFGLSDFQPNMGHVGPGQPCTRTFRSSGYFNHPEVSSAVERGVTVVLWGRWVLDKWSKCITYHCVFYIGNMYDHNKYINMFDCLHMVHPQNFKRYLFHLFWMVHTDVVIPPNCLDNCHRNLP